MEIIIFHKKSYEKNRKIFRTILSKINIYRYFKYKFLNISKI